MIIGVCPVTELRKFVMRIVHIERKYHNVGIVFINTVRDHNVEIVFINTVKDWS